MSLADEVLASPGLKGVKNARVSLTFMVDNGREDQTFRYFRILTPKPITNMIWTGKHYTCTISDGHGLNPDGLRNRIDIVKKDRDSTTDHEAQISFEIILDGTPLTAAGGQFYVFALRASGPHIFTNPGDSGEPPNDYFSGFAGQRDDLHPGNEANTPDDTYPDTDEWLRSYVRNVDIELVDATTQELRSRPGYKRGRFS